jgi:hypothetical protein
MQDYLDEIDFTGSSMYTDLMANKMKNMLKQKAEQMGAKIFDLIAKKKKEAAAKVITMVKQNSNKPGAASDRVASQAASEFEKIFDDACKKKDEPNSKHDEIIKIANAQLAKKIESLMSSQ